MDCNLLVLCGRIVAPAELHRSDSGVPQLRYLIGVRTEHPQGRFDVVPVNVLAPPNDLVAAPGRPGRRVHVIASLQRKHGAVGLGRNRLEPVAHTIALAPHEEGVVACWGASLV